MFGQPMTNGDKIARCIRRSFSDMERVLSDDFSDLVDHPPRALLPIGFGSADKKYRVDCSVEMKISAASYALTCFAAEGAEENNAQ